MGNCPICDQVGLEIITHGRDMRYKGVDISVEGLQYDTCSNCKAEITSPEQLDINAEIIRAAFILERQRVKHELDLLTGSEIRSIREKLGITQKQASKIFGGGPTAFSKYEAEDVVQSVGMDKLLRLAAEVPSAALWLLVRAGQTSVPNKMHMEHQVSFNLGGASFALFPRGNIKTEFFTEDMDMRLGKFDLNAVSSSCNDGDYAGAA